MNSKDKKIAKCLWLIHWAVNIAPRFNGVRNEKFGPAINDFASWELEEAGVALVRLRDKNFSTSYRRKYISPTPPPYSLDLVSFKNKALERYRRITS